MPAKKDHVRAISLLDELKEFFTGKPLAKRAKKGAAKRGRKAIKATAANAKRKVTSKKRKAKKSRK